MNLNELWNCIYVCIYIHDIYHFSDLNHYTINYIFEYRNSLLRRMQSKQSNWFDTYDRKISIFFYDSFTKIFIFKNTVRITIYCRYDTLKNHLFESVSIKKWQEQFKEQEVQSDDPYQIELIFALNHRHSITFTKRRHFKVGYHHLNTYNFRNLIW